MHKRSFLGAALALGAMIAGHQTATTNQLPAGTYTGQVKAEPAPQVVTRQFASRKPAPSKPAARPVTQRQVVVLPQVPMMHDFVRFVERPGPRKVKYGKRRWVVLG